VEKAKPFYCRSMLMLLLLMMMMLLLLLLCVFCFCEMARFNVSLRLYVATKDDLKKYLIALLLKKLVAYGTSFNCTL
jgi:hypothetical protein